MFDGSAIGRQVTAQDAQAALAPQRLIQRANHFPVADRSRFQIFRQRPPGHGQRIAV